MSSTTDIHERLELYDTPENFYVHASEGSECLVIERLGSKMHVGNSAEIPSTASHRPIYGLLGSIRLLAGPYLITVAAATPIGTLNGHRIYLLQKAAVIPFTKTTLHLTESQVAENRALVSMVEGFLSTPGFYFSYTLDLTHSLQRLQNTTPDFLSTPMHERADQRFLWNKHVLRDFALHPDVHRFALPLMHGFIGIREVAIGAAKFRFALISRRSWLRAGTRFWTRGVDAQGHTANFVETEQVVEYGDLLTSNVQCRGSIPLYWSQKPNLRWQPQPTLRGEEQKSGFLAHAAQLKAHYSGLLVLVNLVNGKGREAHMANAFEGVVSASALPDLKYEYFDFHKECKETSWGAALAKLETRLAVHAPGFEFFAATKDGRRDPRKQGGTFRTNCMDSLDRTNVVQALIAKRSLTEQLKWLQILQEGDDIANHTQLEFMFKNIWADNADACSVQYAGTGALKTDFTRFGTRTTSGKVQDGVNAVTRYVKNNFLDGVRQDGISLWVGNWVVEPGVASPQLAQSLEHWKDWKGLVLLSFAFAVAMIILTALLATEHTGVFLLFWFSLVVALGGIIFINGSEFVDQCKLKTE